MRCPTASLCLLAVFLALGCAVTRVQAPPAEAPSAVLPVAADVEVDDAEVGNTEVASADIEEAAPVDKELPKFSVTVILTDNGFEPSAIFLPAGRQIRLVVRNRGTTEPITGQWNSCQRNCCGSPGLNRNENRVSLMMSTTPTTTPSSLRSEGLRERVSDHSATKRTPMPHAALSMWSCLPRRRQVPIWWSVRCTVR